MSYYETNIKCMYRIADGVLYYKSPIYARKVYSRPMIPEIDRIINTMRPVAWRDGCKRFDKIIYENELISINRYVIGEDKVFTLMPPYKDKQIIRYHGEVPMFINGEPAQQPTYESPEYAAYMREQRKLDSQPEKKARRLKRLEYLREYQRRKRQQKKQSNNNN